MPPRFFETRLCLTCGLRFPREQGNSVGIRCPHCLGETEVVFQQTIYEEQMRRTKTAKKSAGVYAVLLDNVRSAWNVGSILRSAEGLGFDQVFLCGITPTPENEAIKKTSLGAEKTIAWSYHKNSVEVIKKLKAEGWKIYALEEHENAVAIHSQLPKRKNQVLILGNEVTGVDNDLLSVCDEIFYIPMQGEKRSFNVAIAFSVAGFVLRQNG